MGVPPSPLYASKTHKGRAPTRLRIILDVLLCIGGCLSQVRRRKLHVLEARRRPVVVVVVVRGDRLIAAASSS